MLSQLVLADQLGVGRTPMREAMQRLEYDGMLVALPQRGWMVRTMSPRDIEETYVIRTRLETLAARRAATLGSPEQVAELRGLVEAQGEAFAAGQSIDKQRSLDRAFHRKIWELADSPRLEQMLSQLVDTAILDPLQQRVITQPGTLRASVAAHDDICQAIESGDADEAERRLAAHSADYWESAIRLLSERTQ